VTSPRQAPARGKVMTLPWRLVAWLFLRMQEIVTEIERWRP
jgi:hypothetical protein